MTSLRSLTVRVMLASSLVATLQAREPACSQFHFEEKILEKMVRLEFAVEQFAQKLDRMENEIRDDSSKNTRDIERFRTHHTSALAELSQVETNLTKQMETIKDEIRPPLVWFRARDPVSMKPSAGQTVVYSNAEINHGTGYNAARGIFTAPRPGLYFFILHTCTAAGDPMRLSIMHDNVQVAGTGISVGNAYDCSTLSVHVKLNAGSRVGVKCTNPGTLQDLSGHFWNSFSGLLIQTL